MKIVVWADGSWASKGEFDRGVYRENSDDVKLLDVPDDLDEGQLDLLIQRTIQGESLCQIKSTKQPTTECQK